jgi:hypothetical protein
MVSFTYGYDPNEDDDDMMSVPGQVSEIISRLLLPGGALVNSFPFCAVCFVIIIVTRPHNYFR